MPFKIITRMEVLLSNYLCDYSYSSQGSGELIIITVTVSLFSLRMQLQEISSFRNSLEFSVAVTWFNGFQIRNVMISKRMVCVGSLPSQQENTNRKIHGHYLVLWPDFGIQCTYRCTHTWTCLNTIDLNEIHKSPLSQEFNLWKI